MDPATVAAITAAVSLTTTLLGIVNKAIADRNATAEQINADMVAACQQAQTDIQTTPQVLAGDDAKIDAAIDAGQSGAVLPASDPKTLV